MPKTVRHENWSLGSNNVAGRAQLPVDRGVRSVREAVNVDIMNGGEFRGRIGYELVESSAPGGAPRGLLKFGESALFFVVGTSLRKFSISSGSSQEVATVSGMAPLIGAEHAGELFMSVGSSHFRYDGIELRRWGVPTPPSVFAVAAEAGGSMQAGIYRLAVVLRNQYGEESRSSPHRTIELTAAGGISVSGLGAPPAGHEHLIYCSLPGSQVMYLHATTTSGSATITQPAMNGVVIGEEFAIGPMGGQAVASHHGQILVASGNILYCSIPMRPHLFSAHTGFYQFPDSITGVCSVDSGVFVTTERETFYLTGIETTEPSQRTVSDIGGYAGSMIRFDTKAVWMTEYGIAEGLQSGEVKYPNRGFYAPVLATNTATGIVRHNGAERIISTIKTIPSASSLAADDYYAATVVHGGSARSAFSINDEFQTEVV